MRQGHLLLLAFSHTGALIRAGRLLDPGWLFRNKSGQAVKVNGGL